MQIKHSYFEEELQYHDNQNQTDVLVSDTGAIKWGWDQLLICI